MLEEKIEAVVIIKTFLFCFLWSWFQFKVLWKEQSCVVMLLIVKTKLKSRLGHLQSCVNDRSEVRWFKSIFCSETVQFGRFEGLSKINQTLHNSVRFSRIIIPVHQKNGVTDTKITFIVLQPRCLVFKPTDETNFHLRFVQDLIRKRENRQKRVLTNVHWNTTYEGKENLKGTCKLAENDTLSSKNKNPCDHYVVPLRVSLCRKFRHRVQPGPTDSNCEDWRVWLWKLFWLLSSSTPDVKVYWIWGTLVSCGSTQRSEPTAWDKQIWGPLAVQTYSWS